ncbi:MAG: hypothetical protein U0446_02250 [Dehalococcoidia bacterium]
MTHPHAPRPTDLVALISFDGEVFENQAVTREALGKPSSPPHALAATIQRWLGRGRHVWIDVRGRQIHGIATARPLGSDEAWQIDTLVDASQGEGGVVDGLLAQATEGAVEAGVSRLLLRTRDDAPARDEAQRAGFMHALDEDLYVLDRPARPPHDATSDGVREVEEADLHGLFQLYSRTLPASARQLLGMTFDEWLGARERRWLGRGAREFAAGDDGRVRATLDASAQGQFSLLIEPGCERYAAPLYAAGLDAFEDAERVLALQPDCLGTPAAFLRDLGFEPRDRYVLLAKRLARPIFEAIPSAAGRTVPTRG